MDPSSFGRRTENLREHVDSSKKPYRFILDTDVTFESAVCDVGWAVDTISAACRVGLGNRSLKANGT